MSSAIVKELYCTVYHFVIGGFFALPIFKIIFTFYSSPVFILLSNLNYRIMPFELFQSEKTGKFHFRLKARNGETILQSQAYNQKAGAQNGIKSVINNASPECIECLKAKDGREYFVIKAKNGEVIGKSQMYKSRSGISNGIKSVVKNASEAVVKDKTD